MFVPFMLQALLDQDIIHFKKLNAQFLIFPLFPRFEKFTFTELHWFQTIAYGFFNINDPLLVQFPCLLTYLL